MAKLSSAYGGETSQDVVSHPGSDVGNTRCGSEYIQGTGILSPVEKLFYSGDRWMQYDFGTPEVLCNSFVELQKKFLRSIENVDYTKPSTYPSHVPKYPFQYYVYVEEGKFLQGSPDSLRNGVRYVFDRDTGSFVHVSKLIPQINRNYHVQNDMKVVRELDYSAFPLMTGEKFRDLKTVWVNNNSVLKEFDPIDTVVISNDVDTSSRLYPNFRIVSIDQHCLYLKIRAKNVVILGADEYYRPLALFAAVFAEAENLALIFPNVTTLQTKKSWVSGLTNVRIIDHRDEAIVPALIESAPIDMAIDEAIDESESDSVIVENEDVSNDSDVSRRHSLIRSVAPARDLYTGLYSISRIVRHATTRVSHIKAGYPRTPPVPFDTIPSFEYSLPSGISALPIPSLIRRSDQFMVQIPLNNYLAFCIEPSLRYSDWRGIYFMAISDSDLFPGHVKLLRKFDRMKATLMSDMKRVKAKYKSSLSSAVFDGDGYFDSSGSYYLSTKMLTPYDVIDGSSDSFDAG